MAITVDYSATPWLITIPQSDLTLISGTQYELEVDTFWQLLRDYSDNSESMPFFTIYNRIPATPSTPSITDINHLYYSLEFEDGAYSVNIINGNTNIRDVEVKNQVSVNTNNTTGFNTISVGSGLSVSEQAQLEELHRMRGLNISSPVTVTATDEVAGDITLDITGDGETTSTLTRQP